MQTSFPFSQVTAPARSPSAVGCRTRPRAHLGKRACAHRRRRAFALPPSRPHHRCRPRRAHGWACTNAACSMSAGTRDPSPAACAWTALEYTRTYVRVSCYTYASDMGGALRVSVGSEEGSHGEAHRAASCGIRARSVDRAACPRRSLTATGRNSPDKGTAALAGAAVRAGFTPLLLFQEGVRLPSRYQYTRFRAPLHALAGLWAAPGNKPGAVLWGSAASPLLPPVPGPARQRHFPARLRTRCRRSTLANGRSSAPVTTRCLRQRPQPAQHCGTV